MGRTKGKITPKGMPTSASALLNAIAQSSTSNSSNNSNSGSSSETNNNGSPKLARSRRLSTRSSSDESLISGSSLSTNQVSGGPLKDEQASAAAAAAAAASTNSSNANAVRLRQGYPSRDPPSDARTQAPLRAFDVEPDWIPCPDDKDCLKHSEFGFCEEQDYRYTSQWRGWEADDLKVTEEEPSLLTYLSTYLSYIILIVIGHVRDFFGRKLRKEAYVHLMEQDGYAPLNSDFDSFYTRRLKTRIDDLFSRPVTGVAGRTITCINRTSDDFCRSFQYTGDTVQAFNISSYNYLGFAQSRGGCADTVEAVIDQYGVGVGGARAEVGTLDIHNDVERLVARFMGTEDATVVSMGFATNSTVLPAIVSKGCLIISDELNHASIRFGARMSGAMVRSFKHNNMDDLENLLRECISQGQPRTHRPWKKILVIVEGLYSMEGTLVNLPVMMNLKRKYKFYLWIDEAHSVGALGPRGRGVCDYFDIDPRQVDILMGTFTKSFGAAGGYIAGNKQIIASLRRKNHSAVYADTMSPAVAQQVISSMASIMGPESLNVIPSLAHTLPTRLLDGSEGLERLRRLAFNSRYLSNGLRKLGFIVYGHRDSPIVPILLFSPGKLPLFSRMMLEKHNIAVVMSAYPATPIISGRARFCLSAAHTKDDLDRVLRATNDVGEALGLKLAPHARMPLEQVLAEAVQDVTEL